MTKIIVFIILIFSQVSFARDKSTLNLQENGRLGIDSKECISIENKLGQLLYVNVDGYGTSGNQTIHPAYIAMVKDLNIGGVIAHPGGNHMDDSKNHVNDLQNDFKKLKAAPSLPLLIGVDNGRVSLKSVGTREFGLGYGFGLLEDTKNQSNECFEKIAYLNAFYHRAVGLNHSLGPTVESNKRSSFLTTVEGKRRARQLIMKFNNMGVATTMKHFPYTPETFNLHGKSEDTKIPADIVYKMLENFNNVNNEADFAMSTHLLNSNIDKEDMATFSKIWIDLLRSRVGFKGILITDGLFMFKSYDETMKNMSSKWPQDQIKIEDEYTIFAARSILAGHDMAFLEGTSKDTYRIFNDLLYIACQDKPVSIDFRNKINESYSRISAYKNKNRSTLLEDVEVPTDLIKKAMLLNWSDSCKFDDFKKEIDALGILPLSRVGNNSSKIRQSSGVN